MEYRYYQQEADDAIFNDLQINDKCLVKMFCGTGKSLIMSNCKIVQNQDLIVYVFPILGLIKQFYDDYLIKKYNAKNMLKISSESEIDSTTDEEKIKKFLNKKTNKIICITYQSFGTLKDCLNNLNKKINICVFDEAHHSVSIGYKELIFNDCPCEKQIFFTATPKKANGLTMYDMENYENGDCGNLVYDYSYLNGVNENYLNPIEIRIDFSSENTNTSLYQSISRTILASGNNRVLTFHADVETDRDKSARKFVELKKFIKEFNHVRKNEFPEIDINKYKNIKMDYLSADKKKDERTKILNKLDETKNDEIMIICSCKTIGEGIDTKKANMCVFIDPKSSYVDIIQNIGRIVRKDLKVNCSTVLIPCWVDKNKYLECNGDKEKCDEAIRKDMDKTGNFNGILNVLSALKQEDPELYEICLHYPDKYSPQEIIQNLAKLGYVVKDPIENGDLIETINYLIDDEIEIDEYLEDDEELIHYVAQEKNICIEVHTHSLENPIEIYNEECKRNTIRLLKNENDIISYQPIEKRCGTKRNSELMTKPEKSKRLHVNVHTNPDIKVLWNIKDGIDLTKNICSCVIDCEVVSSPEKWKLKLDEVKTYILENEKSPSTHDKDKTIKTLGKWISHQKENYDPDIKKCKGTMKNQEIYDLWKEFINDERFKKYVVIDLNENWKQSLQEVKTYILENEKKPSDKDKDETIKKLGTWICNQKQNYDPDIEKSKQGLKKNKEIYDLWKEFINAERFKKYIVIDLNENWKQSLQEVKTYILENNKLPSARDKDETIKTLGNWISNQKANYDPDIEKCKYVMKNQEIHDLWKKFIHDETFKKYIVIDLNENWKQSLQEVKTYILINKKSPSTTDKDETTKTLGTWIGTQKKNYDPDISKCKERMKNQEIHDLWKEFIHDERFKKYIDLNENWKQSLQEVKTYILKNKKSPSKHDKDETIKKLGLWISHQKANYDPDIEKSKERMINQEIHDLWKKFINDERFKKYIDLNENWKQTLQQAKTYILINEKSPSKHDKDETIKTLGNWISNQKKNYDPDIAKCKNIMKNQEIYDLWSDFINDERFKKYIVIDLNENWQQSLQEVKTYILKNEKSPSTTDKDKTTKKLGT